MESINSQKHEVSSGKEETKNMSSDNENNTNPTICLIQRPKPVEEVKKEVKKEKKEVKERTKK